ncbi:MAG TPA: hypothetical protein VFF30_12825 [Nitrososphaerales archaeon]|nr:hypothetical protein [Nitrososphaerales archaeon]
MTSSNAKLVRNYDLYREAIKELIRKVSSLYVGEAELAKSAKSLGIPVRAGNDPVSLAEAYK